MILTGGTDLTDSPPKYCLLYMYAHRPDVHCRLSVPAAVEARAVQGLSAARLFPPAWFFKAGFPQTAEPLLRCRGRHTS